MISGNLKSTDRMPAVAGKFYSKDPNELRDEIKKLFREAKQEIKGKKPRALMVPHAGYIFSGPTAASGYKQISNYNYDNIFIIGTSHQMRFEGVSVFNQGNYITPFGQVDVNLDIANKLIKNNHFHFVKEAHHSEHSIEVQLPFLQYMYNDVKIIPILVGTDSRKILKEISHTLNPYFNENNLFLISTDFSHYPSYDDAIKVDKKTAESIITNDPDRFIETIHQNMDLNINNLATSICGWTSVLILLFITSEKEKINFEIVDYKNSGDQPIFADKSRVVGYYSMMARED